MPTIVESFPEDNAAPQAEPQVPAVAPAAAPPTLTSAERSTALISAITQTVGNGASLEGEAFANAIDRYILDRSVKSRENQAEVACGLWLSKASEAYKRNGYAHWREYTQAMVQVHQLFGSTRQADRYVHAVQTWVVDLGFDRAVLTEFGPSVLGEIAQAGVVSSIDEANAWIEVVKNMGPAAVRNEIARNRGLLDTSRRAALPAPGPDTTAPAEPQRGDTVVIPPADVTAPYDEEGGIDQLQETARKSEKIAIQVVEDEDSTGPCFHIQLYRGGIETGQPLTFFCRDFDFRQMTKEEASLFEAEMKRAENLREVDKIMTE